MIYGLKKRKIRFYLILGLLTVLVIYLGKSGALGWAGIQLQNYQPGLYSITHFVDGDTIVVDMNGHDEIIRFIGVDTPETHKPNTPVQCFGTDASDYTKYRLNGKRIQLVSDPLSTDRDRYGRLLRYIYLTDGTNFDLELIAKGYAFYYPYFPFTKSDAFGVAERRAINSSIGLWAKCKPIPTDSGGFVSNPL
jgi:micrococcal nuclease